MTSLPAAAQISRKLTSILCSACLVCSAAFAQEGKTGPAANQDAQQPGKLGPASPSELRAARKRFLDRYLERAKALQGPRVIESIAFADATLASLLYVRDVYVAALKKFISEMSDFSRATQDTKDARLKQMIDNVLARDLLDRAIRFDGRRDILQETANRAAMLSPEEAAWWQNLLKQPKKSMLQMLQSRRNELNAQKDPLLGFNGGLLEYLINTYAAPWSEFYDPHAFAMLQGKLDDTISQAIKDSLDEINRVNEINDVEGISEFLLPQYAAVWTLAAQAGGTATAEMISLLIPFATSFQQTRLAQSEVSRLKVALFVTIFSGIAILLVAPAAGVGATIAGGSAGTLATA